MRTMSGSPCLHYECSNRNSFGYCKTTVCINKQYQQEQWVLQSTTNKTESVVIKQRTNADRIRAKSVEEMAEFLETLCPSYNWTLALNGMTWLDWLKQEEE